MKFGCVYERKSGSKRPQETWYTLGIMLTRIQQFLDRTTMYKVVMYSLTTLIMQAFIMSALDIIPYSPTALLLSLATISLVGIGSHLLFQKIYKAPANIESTYISIFIAFLILAPASDLSRVLWSACAVFLIIASKYLVVHSHRHLFNPVALGVFVIGLMGSISVTWWVGSMYFLPTVIITAFLVIHKLKRHTLFFSYLIASLATVAGLSFLRGDNILEGLLQHTLSWPLLFLGVFMLTEPLTTPPTRKLQGIYGVIVGVLSSFPYAFPPVYGTPELALLIGNVSSFAVSTKSRVFLSLIEKKEIAKDTFELVFKPSEKVPYEPGQYMEWTLSSEKADIRGIRRYFTIASSPLEDVIRLGVKRAEKGSSFKNSLFALESGKGLLATSVMGDFLLPEDKDKTLVFIAGGIGITPFISMLRTLLIKKEKRDIVLLYANKQESEIAYKDVLEEAMRELGVRVVYVLSDLANIPHGWTGERGFITQEIIEAHVSAVISSSYYISGPPAMVSSYSDLLESMHVCKKDITTDFFPGFN